MVAGERKRIGLIGIGPSDTSVAERWAADQGLEIVVSPCGERSGHVTIVLCSIDDGLHTLETTAGSFAETPIVALGSDIKASTIVAAFRAGAVDALSRPLDPRALGGVLDRCPRAPHRSVVDASPSGNAIGLLRESTSPVVLAVCDAIERISPTDVGVLVRGESGTGKEIVARAIHELSDRAMRPFVKVNCAALPTELLESELFGFERGAFTGAEKRKLGKFEHAEGGTIFLDEIGEVAPPLQAKLLQVLQDGEFSRLGGQQDIRVNVRIVAATNRDLEAAVANGDFREDLFYRINVVGLQMPALRDRIEDIPGLAEQFTRAFAQEYGREFVLSPDQLDHLKQHHWPGNVRELENTIRRLVVLGEKCDLEAELQSASGDKLGASEPSANEGQERQLKVIAKSASQAAEKAVMERVLEQTRWNRKEAARRLSISYKALLYKMRENGLRELH